MTEHIQTITGALAVIGTNANPDLLKHHSSKPGAKGSMPVMLATWKAEVDRTVVQG